MKQLLIFVFIFAAVSCWADESAQPQGCARSLKRGEKLTLEQIHAAFYALAANGVPLKLKMFQKNSPENNSLISQAVNMRIGMDYLYESVMKHFKTVGQAVKYFEKLDDRFAELKTKPKETAVNIDPFVDARQSEGQAQPLTTTAPAAAAPRTAIATPTTATASNPPQSGKVEAKVPAISPATLKRVLRALLDRSYIPYGFFMLQPPENANVIVSRIMGQPFTTVDLLNFMVSENLDYWQTLQELGLSPELNLLRSRRRAAIHYTPQELSMELRRFQTEILTQPLSRVYWYTLFDLVILEAPTADKALVQALLRILIERPSRSLKILRLRVSEALKQDVTREDIERAYNFLANNRSLLSFLGL